MFNLLKLEFRRLKKQKSFYICSLIMIILIILSAITNSMMSATEELSILTDTSVIGVLLSAISNCSFTLIAGIFVVLFVCEDYEQQTIKNIYSRGYTHNDVYFSKLISSLTATSIMYIIMLVISYLINFLLSGSSPDSLKLSPDNLYLSAGNTIYIIIAQFFVVTAYMCLDYAICSFLKKNGSSIAAIIVCPLIVNIIIGLINGIIKSDSFNLGKYWLSSLLNLVSSANNNIGEITFSFIGALIYIFILVILGAVLHQPASYSKQKKDV